MLTEHQKEVNYKAHRKYIVTKTDQILFRTEKGKKEQIKAFAEANGESLNGFINRAIDEAMAGK